MRLRERVAEFWVIENFCVDKGRGMQAKGCNAGCITDQRSGSHVQVPPMTSVEVERFQ
jgi:hypothetical protein